jgi:hypothetical protein
LLQSPHASEYARQAKRSEVLYPFGEEAPREYARASSVKRFVPIAVKAAWRVIDPRRACEEPDSAMVRFYNPATISPGIGANDAYPIKMWPDARVVDLTGSITCAAPAPAYKRPSGANVVPISRFYKFKIQEDSPDGSLRKGSLALLVGLHVATRETKDWVWRTFWWDPDPKNPKLGTAAPADAGLKAPWDQYVMGANFNPYLEAGMKNGRVSNCVSCHRMAVIGRKMADGEHCLSAIPENAPAFVKNRSILTDYLWSVAAQASGAGAKAWTCAEFYSPGN